MSWCCLSDSPQIECVVFFPDQTEMNYIFRLFVVTNPAIFPHGGCDMRLVPTVEALLVKEFFHVLN